MVHLHFQTFPAHGDDGIEVPRIGADQAQPSMSIRSVQVRRAPHSHAIQDPDDARAREDPWHDDELT